MRKLIIAGALAAALAYTGAVSAETSFTPGRNDAHPPVLCCNDQPGRYLTVGSPIIAPTPAPVRFLLPPNTCGDIGGRRYCAREDGSLILIW